MCSRWGKKPPPPVAVVVVSGVSVLSAAAIFDLTTVASCLLAGLLASAFGVAESRPGCFREKEKGGSLPPPLLPCLGLCGCVWTKRRVKQKRAGGKIAHVSPCISRLSLLAVLFGTAGFRLGRSRESERLRRRAGRTRKDA